MLSTEVEVESADNWAGLGDVIDLTLRAAKACAMTAMPRGLATFRYVVLANARVLYLSPPTP